MSDELGQCKYWRLLGVFTMCGKCRECKWYQGQQNPNWRDEN